MVTGIEHTAILSSEPAKLKDWYIKVFDFKQVYDNGKGTYFVKAQNGYMLEFVLTDKAGEIPSDHTLNGIRHIAIGVDVNNFEAMVKKLEAENVDVITKPAISDKGIGTFFFRDPEGNVLHLISRTTPL